MKQLSCHDCGAVYGEPGWIEAVVPHEVWNTFLSPTGDEGGILCIVCMGRRAAAWGLEDIPVQLTSGPFTTFGTAHGQAGKGSRNG